jgi:hypothetical protein
MNPPWVDAILRLFKAQDSAALPIKLSNGQGKEAQRSI